MRVVVLVAPEARAAIVRALEGGGHLVAPESERGDGGRARELVITDDVRRVEKLRAHDPTLAILVVTPGDDVLARVAALRAGADDALSSPFHASQMVARVDALGRRGSLVPHVSDVVVADACTIDLDALTAERAGVRVELSPLEVSLIRFLVRHASRAVSRTELLEHVWGHSSSMETRTIDMTVARLRKKLERDASDPRILVGVRGVGYRWGTSE